MRRTVDVVDSVFGSHVWAKEGDYVWVTFGGETMLATVDTIREDGVFVTIDLTRRGFYEWSELDPLTQEELKALG